MASVRAFFLLFCLASAACTPEAENAALEPEESPAEAGLDSVQVVEGPFARTANPFVRGYSRSDFPRVKEIGPGVFTYEQLRSAGDEWFTTVSMFVVTTDGVLVADGQGSVEETERLLTHIAEVTERPVTHVVVSSDHGDHTAGNDAFPENAVFLAHPTSAETLRSAAEAREEGDPAVRVPGELVENRRVLTLGGRTIELLHLGRAHTGGDLLVYLPQEKILFMSETFLPRIFPAMRTAYPSEWLEMLNRAQRLDVDMFVPGHGFVDYPAVLAVELERFKQALATVIDEATRLYDAGVPVDDAVEQANFGELESWSLRESQGPRAIRQVYAQLEGALR